jgi:hypothetical protein
MVGAIRSIRGGEETRFLPETWFLNRPIQFAAEKKPGFCQKPGF